MEKSQQKLIYTFGALAEIGQEITTRQDFQEMMRTSLHLLLGSLAIMRGGVARFSRLRHEMNVIAIRGFADDFPAGLAIRHEDERFLVDRGIAAIDAGEAEELIFFRNALGDFRQKPIELLIPLTIEEEIVGLIFLGEKANGEPYSGSDKEIICAMCRHIAVGISQRNLMVDLERRAEENRRLYDDLRLTYKHTVQAFAAAIDYKDNYTEGHSVRVGKYSEIIAAELGWDEEAIEGAAVAGYLHDIGKLTVERNIINAPYRINAKESADLNKHPAVGYQILLPIHHPYTDVPLAAKYHHERIDGNGYPDGLVDREIPLIAKIVNLADSFDSMTTNLPYKLRRSADEVILDLVQNSGKQFAPDVVAAFLSGMLNEVTGKQEKKVFRRLLGRDYIHPESFVPRLKSALNEISGTSSLTLVA